MVDMYRIFRACLISTAVLLTVAGPSPLAVAADATPRQWYLDAMKAEAMWRVSTGKGIKVAVIGTGVNPHTPSLRGQVLKGVDALVKHGLSKGRLTDTADTTGEGTTLAELIAGTGAGGGLKGLAPGAKIIPIRVPPVEHDEAPDPNYPLATAIRAAVDMGAQIIDVAVGNQYVIASPFGSDAALDYAIKKGVLMIAGTGDNAKEGNKPQYPAAYEQFVGVGASDRNGTVTPTSQHGKHVDIAAPGAGIPRWCNAKFQRYCPDGGGTKAAAAVVSASAALLWSHHPGWTASQVWRVLEDTAGRDWPVATPSNYLGYGLNRPAQNLLNGRGNPGNPDPNTNPAAIQPVAATSSPSTSVAPAGAPAQNRPKGGGLPVIPIIAVATAAAIVLAGGAALALRRRRAR